MIHLALIFLNLSDFTFPTAIRFRYTALNTLLCITRLFFTFARWLNPNLQILGLTDESNQFSDLAPDTNPNTLSFATCL